MNFFRRNTAEGQPASGKLTRATPELRADAHGADPAAPEIIPEDPYAELGLLREALAPEPAAERRAAAPADDFDFGFRHSRWTDDMRDDPPASSPGGGDSTDYPAGSGVESAFHRSADARAHRAAPTPRRIWDIEPDTMSGGSAQDPAGSSPQAYPTQPIPGCTPDPHASPPPDNREPLDDVALARAQIAQFSRADLQPERDRSAGARAKTRLLGFQSRELSERDPFAREALRGGRVVPTFPVGWIVVIGGPGRGACFALTSGVSSIGRGEDQTIRLDFGDTSISRHNHASIAFDDEANRFFLGHGGKSNIVRLNERPVLSTEDLAGGDTIRIGETVLHFVAFCGDGFVWSDGEDAPETADVAAE